MKCQIYDLISDSACYIIHIAMNKVGATARLCCADCINRVKIIVQEVSAQCWRIAGFLFIFQRRRTEGDLNLLPLPPLRRRACRGTVR